MQRSLHGVPLPNPDCHIRHIYQRWADCCVGPQDALSQQYPTEERLDAHGQYVMPGSICAHTHFYGAYSRGMGIPGSSPKDFPEILGKLWWPLDKALTPEDVYYSAVVCLIDAVRHGTTTLIDHHASPNAIEGSLDQVARAVEDTGVRAALCYEVTDRGWTRKSAGGCFGEHRLIERAGMKGVGRPPGGDVWIPCRPDAVDETLKSSREAVK